MTEKEIANKYELARRAKMRADWSVAATYYQALLEENPNDWEACFYVGVANATGCTLSEFKFGTSRLHGAFADALALVISYEEAKAKLIIEEMVEMTTLILKSFKSSAQNLYIKYPTVQNAKNEYNEQRYAVALCAAQCAKSIEGYVEDYELQKLCLPLLKMAVELRYDVLKECPNSIWKSLRINIDECVADIQKYDSKFKNPVDTLIEKRKLEAEKFELGEKIERLTETINSIVTERKRPKLLSFLGVLILIPTILLSIGIIGASLTNIKDLFAFVLVVPLLALALLCFRKKPSKAVIKQNTAKKEQLTKEKAAITKRLDEVIRLTRSM
ncbi:MAG: hypothetical protein IKL46_09110 [Clostridia bacterium]|nr:hypothetical protein [Clostridia bacterium]